MNTRISRHKNPYVTSFFMLFLFIILTVSCGNRPIGYGVVLWTHDENIFQNGQMVQISLESDLRDTYTLFLNDEVIEVERWRMEFFKRKTEAEQFAASYAPLSETYARALRDGQPPLRERAELNAPNLYRFRLNEEVKVIQRLPEEVTIGQYTDYWYELLTIDGTRGFSFGELLEIFTTDEVETAPEEDEESPILDRFFNKIYRPEHLYQLVQTETIKLEEFRKGYGLFPDRENGIIRMFVPRLTMTFSFQDIEQTGNNTFRFTGSDLSIRFINEDEIIVTYPQNGQSIARRFCFIPDMDELLTAEIERREELYISFLEAGRVLSSSAYGTIELLDMHVFNWNDYDRLVPSIIPQGAGNTGTVTFDLFPARDLRDEYNGVITFNFSAGNSRIHFLYTLEERGVRFVQVPSDTIEDQVVTRLSASPIIIYLSFKD